MCTYWSGLGHSKGDRSSDTEVRSYRDATPPLFRSFLREFVFECKKKLGEDFQFPPACSTQISLVGDTVECRTEISQEGHWVEQDAHLRRVSLDTLTKNRMHASHARSTYEYTGKYNLPTRDEKKKERKKSLHIFRWTSWETLARNLLALTVCITWIILRHIYVYCTVCSLYCTSRRGSGSKTRLRWQYQRAYCRVSDKRDVSIAHVADTWVRLPGKVLEISSKWPSSISPRTDERRR